MYRDGIEKARSEDPIPRAVLVCGVDVDESTELKINNPMNGTSAILDFMQYFDLTLRNRDSIDGDSEKDSWFLWRVRGDELVYFRTIPVDGVGNPVCSIVKRYVNQFVDAIQKQYPGGGSSPDCIPLGLHGYAFLLHSKRELWEFSWNFIPRNLLGKAGVQIEVEEKVYDSDRNLANEAIFSEYKGSLREIHEDYFVDFIGRDVDLGFRIAEYSRPHYFVLSPKLARCMLNGSEEEKKKQEILFLGFYEMKGCSIGGQGPDRFPLCFLPIENRGKPVNEGILRNYKIFSMADAERKLEEFEEYENASCEIKYKEFCESQNDKSNGKRDKDELILEDIGIGEISSLQEGEELFEEQRKHGLEVLELRLEMLEERVRITRQRIADLNSTN